MSVYMSFMSENANNPAAGNLVVVAGAHPIRVVLAEAYNRNVSYGFVLSYQIVRNSSPSGGSVKTPTPLREGAPASTAVSRSLYTSLGAGSSFQVVKSIAVGIEQFLTFTFPLDVLLNAGSGFAVSMAPYSGQSSAADPMPTIAIYFEELRQLSWPL